MHNAPPVVYPVGRFAWGIGCVWVLALVGAVGLLCWQLVSQAVGALTWWAWSLWLVSCALAIWMAPKEASDRGHLVWADGVWHWRDERSQESPVRLSLLFDFGHTLWVSCRPTHDARWIRGLSQFAIVHRASMPLAWHGFRCAVYSRPSEIVAPGEQYSAAREI